MIDPSPCVLVVEHDPAMRGMVRNTLAQFGCGNIVVAEDGEAALVVSAGRRLELVVCDWQMAPMDAPGFLRALRQRDGGAGVPVIMLTATDAAGAADRAEREDRAERADRAEGADRADREDRARGLMISAWLTKPISPVRLLERVRAVLGPRARASAGPDEVAARELADRYQAKLGSDLAAIQSALAALPYRDSDRPAAWRTLERTLHDIKGQAATFDYELVTALARRGHDLLRIALDHPGPAAKCHVDIARALGSITTAMQRVAQNRVRGDGGEAGLRLVAKLDAFIAPLRASLGD